METIPISKFKATCLAVLERVRTTGEAVLVTKRGVPLAEVIPPTRTVSGERPLGDLADTGRILGDIVSPVVEEDEWETLRK